MDLMNGRQLQLLHSKTKINFSFFIPELLKELKKYYNSKLIWLILKQRQKQWLVLDLLKKAIKLMRQQSKLINHFFSLRMRRKRLICFVFAEVPRPRRNQPISFIEFHSIEKKFELIEGWAERKMACFGWWLICFRGYGPEANRSAEGKTSPTKKASQKQRERSCFRRQQFVWMEWINERKENKCGGGRKKATSGKPSEARQAPQLSLSFVGPLKRRQKERNEFVEESEWR